MAVAKNAVAAKKASRPAAKKRPAPAVAGRHIKVRMYNVGFGDAFLVEIPDGAARRRILFDCGSIQASQDGGAMKSIVKRIIDDVTDTHGDAHIDVVVATHRHKDHVSGFGDEAWDQVGVKEVWLPWTEHPTDAQARRIRDIQGRMAVGLQASIAELAVSADAKTMREIDRYRGIVDNALMLSNDKAMRTLHGGFAGNPKRRFLPNKEEPRTFETPTLPGVKIHVLGPSRSRDVIRDMDPPLGESFLRMRRARGTDESGPQAPFAAEFEDHSATQAGFLSAEDQQEIQKAGSKPDLAIAVALDKAVNGTSLMIIIEVAGTYLLFPGDAQWGTWLGAMEDAEWNDMLKRVSFYKIGHHGSHNATPTTFVRDLLPQGCCTMVSTLVRKIWPDIPRDQLFTALLRKKASIARSDKPKANEPFRIDNGVVEARIAL